MLNMASDASVTSETPCERAVSVDEPEHVPLNELEVSSQVSDALVPGRVAL
jgi:hypothetical protein